MDKFTQKRYGYTVKFQPEPEGGYTVTVPFLRGLVTYGKTKQKAERNAKQAIKLHLESLEARNKSVPKERVKTEKVPFFARIYVPLSPPQILPA